MTLKQQIRVLILTILAALLPTAAWAEPSCAQRNPPLPEFSKDINRNAAWNAYVSANLNAQSSLAGLAQGFKAQQCPSSWGNPRTYIGIKFRDCTVTSPMPVINGTQINYGATANNNAIVHLRGCGAGVTELPTKLTE